MRDKGNTIVIILEILLNKYILDSLYPKNICEMINILICYTIVITLLPTCISYNNVIKFKYTQYNLLKNKI